MKSTDALFAARYVAGSISSGDMVAFADSRLSEGIYSDHYLSIIDEQQKNLVILSNYLELAFKEFGVSIPSYEQAIWQIVEHHVDSIISEACTPMEGFKNLLDDLNDFDLHKGIEKYVGDNIGIAEMYGWYYSVDDGVKIDDINSGIFAECQNWKKRYGKTH